MQILIDGQVKNFREAFQNVSFSANGPDEEFLLEHGAVVVSHTRQFNPATQKLVACDPVVENGVAYVVEVVDRTADEIAADVAGKAATVRAERDRALSASDWTQVADAPVDQEAWASYRQALRDMPEQEGFPMNVTWPAAPGSQEFAGNAD